MTTWLRRPAIVFGILLAACSPMASPAPAPSVTLPPSDTPAPLPTASQTLTANEPPPASDTPKPPDTPTPSVTPTFAILRGTLNVDRASCRYGPGAMYLYLYGLLRGANQEIIGRTDTGSWVLTRAPGDKIRCWVKASLLDINGDVMGVEQVEPHIVLPWSPYYGPIVGVSAARNGDEVTISWNYVQISPGDDSEQTPYVVETWVCQGGKLIFTPIGSYQNIVNVTDEAGCEEPSFGVVMAAEKHGYTWPVEIPWPPHQSP